MSQMEGEAEELNKKLQTLQQQHNQAYELLKNLQAKESAGFKHSTITPVSGPKLPSVTFRKVIFLEKGEKAGG